MRMAAYRTRVRLIGDILSSTRDGVSLSHLTRQASASHCRVTSIVHTLVNRGLVEQVGSKRSRIYRISERGQDYLQEYRVFRNSLEQCGMPI